MPTYNGQAYLAEAIESALQQKYKHMELLICDDASTDGTIEIIQRYAQRDHRIHFWKNDSRLGLFTNYNECMSEAKGDLIKPFAQDDLLHPNALELMVNAFSNNDVALVACGKKCLDSSRKSLAENVETELPAGRSSGRQVIESCLRSYRNIIGEPVSVLFDAAKVGRGFNEAYYSLGDLEYWFRILEKSDLFYMPDQLVTFRRHPDSATDKMLDDMTWILDFFRLGKEYESYLADLGIGQEEYFCGFIDRAGELIDRLADEMEVTPKGLSGFKEVAFYAMRRSAQLAAKGREYDSVVQSTSWKITEPLRYIKTKIDKKTTPAN